MVDSVCKAEYIAASDAAKEAVWLRKFLGELGVVPTLESPILVYCDSIGAIAHAKEPKLHHRTKHVLCRYHLVREIMERGDVDLQKIDEMKNLADPMTKALRIKEFNEHKWKMDIRYCSDCL